MSLTHRESPFWTAGDHSNTLPDKSRSPLRPIIILLMAACCGCFESREATNTADGSQISGIGSASEYGIYQTEGDESLVGVLESAYRSADDNVMLNRDERAQLCVDTVLAFDLSNPEEALLVPRESLLLDPDNPMRNKKLSTQAISAALKSEQSQLITLYTILWYMRDKGEETLASGEVERLDNIIQALDQIAKALPSTFYDEPDPLDFEGVANYLRRLKRRGRPAIAPMPHQ